MDISVIALEDNIYIHKVERRQDDLQSCIRASADTLRSSSRFAFLVSADNPDMKSITKIDVIHAILGFSAEKKNALAATTDFILITNTSAQQITSRVMRRD